MTPPRRLRIATRASALALWQAEHVAAKLRAFGVGEVELVKIRTEGDRILDRPLAELGGKGLFVKEIEQAIIEGRADLAIHSLKDVPTALAPGLVLGAIMEREDARDALIVRTNAGGLADLPPGATVGTSSLRRMCQLRNRRPDLVIEPLRGNVDTRLRRLDEGKWDAIVLAAAGLRRLGLGGRITEVLAADLCLPAIGQGALAVEVSAADAMETGRLHDLLTALHHADTAACVTAERALLARLEGGCQTPIAGHATLEGQAAQRTLRLAALVGDTNGATILREAGAGEVSQAAAIGEEVAARLLHKGAAALLQKPAIRP